MKVKARPAPELLDRLPVLTQVVRPSAGESPAAAGRDAAAPPQALEEAVLGRVTRQLDLLLEARLREAVAPALARAADGLVRELREQLAADLRGMVAEALAQERDGQRPG